MTPRLPKKLPPRKPSAMKVRRIEGILVSGLPGVVSLRTSTVDDDGYRAEAGVMELSIVAALALARRLIDAAVSADDQAERLPPDCNRMTRRTA